jgi:glycosyltransferase involved in cell wall biosynthesis
MKKITFIAWVHFHRRTELLAQHLGATLHFIQYGQLERVLQAPFRYPVQARQTWRILRRERPDVILVQNPPIFCALVAFLFGWRHGAQYVIDSHTGAFVSLKWRWSLWLHRLLSKRALTTLVHNKSQETLVERWGCPYLVLAYTPGDCSSGEHFPLGRRFNVALISSFRGDERPDIVFEAASHLPEVDFYLTGNSERLSRAVLAQKPENCHLTGYLSYDRYVGLLRGADAIMALTTRDDTLLMGGFEALWMGKPFITSDWPVLKDYFSLGTVHVPYTVEGICRGVRLARTESDTLQRDILRLRDLREKEWQQKLAQLQGLLRGG